MKRMRTIVINGEPINLIAHDNMHVVNVVARAFVLSSQTIAKKGATYSIRSHTGDPIYGRSAIGWLTHVFVTLDA